MKNYLLILCVGTIVSCGSVLSPGYINQRSFGGASNQEEIDSRAGSSDSTVENEAPLFDDSVDNEPFPDNFFDKPEEDTPFKIPHKFNNESQYNLCSENWIDASQLQIGMNTPKELSGDTFAGYGPVSYTHLTLPTKA